MADQIKQIQLGTRAWQIQGDDQDKYFLSAQDHARPITATLLKIAAQRVKPTSTILDIGANIGLSTLGLSELVPEGRVIAFEPSPGTARHLAANIAANDVRNVTVASVAVGSQAGTVVFAQTPSFSAGNFVVQDVGENRPALTVNVPMVVLDEWLDEAGVSKIDFVKLDVEGYEPWALDGARRMLSRDRPPIFMEFNSWTLVAFGDVNPVAFARGLSKAYRLAQPGQNGALGPEIVNPLSFAHGNMVRRGCVEDILMELRDAVEPPRLAEMLGAH